MRAPSKNAGLPPVAAWVHVVVGGIGLAAACLVTSRTGAIGLVIGSIVFVSWAARRGPGLMLAFVAGLIEVYRHGANRVGPVAILAMLYVGIALATSAVERATRPSST